MLSLGFCSPAGSVFLQMTGSPSSWQSSAPQGGSSTLPSPLPRGSCPEWRWCSPGCACHCDVVSLALPRVAPEEGEQGPGAPAFRLLRSPTLLPLHRPWSGLLPPPNLTSLGFLSSHWSCSFWSRRSFTWCCFDLLLVANLERCSPNAFGVRKGPCP